MCKWKNLAFRTCDLEECKYRISEVSTGSFGMDIGVVIACIREFDNKEDKARGNSCIAVKI